MSSQTGKERKRGRGYQPTAMPSTGVAAAAATLHRDVVFHHLFIRLNIDTLNS